MFAFGTTPGADLVRGVGLVQSSAVPEPSSLILSASGFASWPFSDSCVHGVVNQALPEQQLVAIS